MSAKARDLDISPKRRVKKEAKKIGERRGTRVVRRGEEGVWHSDLGETDGEGMRRGCVMEMEMAEECK